MFDDIDILDHRESTEMSMQNELLEAIHPSLSTNRHLMMSHQAEALFK